MSRSGNRGRRELKSEWNSFNCLPTVLFSVGAKHRTLPYKCINPEVFIERKQPNPFSSRLLPLNFISFMMIAGVFNYWLLSFSILCGNEECSLIRPFFVNLKKGFFCSDKI